MLKYKMVQRGNPSDAKQSKKWYAMPVHKGRKSIQEISEDVSKTSSLSRGDIQNALMSLVDRLPDYLLQGQSVHLGELGTLRIGFSSQGVANQKDFSTRKIKDLKIIFTPGKKLKQSLKQSRFQKA